MMFVKPGLENTEATEKINNKSDKATEQISEAKSKAEEGIENVRDKATATSGDSLNPQELQKTNIAKTGGSKGNINNKDFNSTLNLMRRADKYNNKPITEMHSVGTRHTGDIQNLGTGYERPKIETMETRAMNQAVQLDTQQKQLAIALQDAINHKDIDAFIAAYQQLFGVQLSTMQAEQAIRTWMQQQQATNIATKDISSWQKDFTRAFDVETLQYLVGLAENGDEQLATLLSNAMYGLPTPSLDERILQDSVNNLAQSYVSGSGMSPLRARLKASNVVNYLLLENDNATASSTKRSQRPGEQYAGYKEAKGISKEAKGL